MCGFQPRRDIPCIPFTAVASGFQIRQHHQTCPAVDAAPLTRLKPSDRAKPERCRKPGG